MEEQEARALLAKADARLIKVKASAGATRAAAATRATPPDTRKGQMNFLRERNLSIETTRNGYSSDVLPHHVRPYCPTAASDQS